MRILTLLAFLLAAPVAVLGQATQPASTGTPRQSLTRAHSLLQQGDVAQAMAILQQLESAHPPVKGLQHELGIAYYRTSKLAEAQKAFATAIQEDPSDKEAIQMEGLTLYRMGQPAKAIPYLERVRDWMPDADADSNYVLGLCYLNARRYDDAREAFAREFNVEPGSASAYLLLGNMLMHANLPEIAAGEAQKALQLDPKLPLAHFMLGEVYLNKSDVQDATQEFEQERRLNPGYAPTYDRLGDLYTRIGKLQEAQQALTKAISLDTSSTGPFIQMGKVLLHRDDPVTAIMYLRHAEKMDPSNFITHTLLAQAYRKTGLQDDSKRETELASKIHAADELKLQPVQ
ncbi:MAG: tetratricopeptide repeat protein [Acidobacteriaceae bacterium]